MASLATASEKAAERAARFRAAAAALARSPAVRAAFAALLVAGGIVLLRQDGWLQPAELLAYDTLRVAWAGHRTSDRVVLVGATDADIDADHGQRWPWPLPDDKLAALLDRLASWQPRAIGVDIYRDIPIYRDAPRTGEDPLDALLRQHPEIYWVFRFRPDKTHPGTQPPKLLRGTPRAVFADIPEDPGGIVRRALLFQDDGKTSFTGLGTALALAYLAPLGIVPQAAAGDAMRLGKAVIPPLETTSGPYVDIDSRGYQLLYDYQGGPQPFREESLSAVMTRNDLAAVVRGRVVIIGVDADSVHDAFWTPFSTGFADADQLSGIAMHAHLVDQLIREALGQSPVLSGLPRLWEDVWTALWAIGGALLGLFVRSTPLVTAGAAGGIGAIAGIVYVVFGRAVLLPAVPAALAWVGAGVLTNQLLYAASNRARARLRQSFEHYLPPAVIDHLVAHDVLPALGGEHREISVLFSDVAGFTNFSEGRDPAELAGITNQYLEGVCNAIFAQDGLVNAFMGDGVLAFFGAPHHQPDHADRAVDAVLAIDRFAEAFRAEQNARGIDFGLTRIGVHTGVAFVGNIGSRRRLQYTALGDMLNTGSRLEGLNKAIGSRICVSRDVVERCRRHRFQRVGTFIVKGRQTATEVFTPLDPYRPPPPWLDRYAAALSALEAAAPDAAARFAELQREAPDNPCIAFHCRRLAQGESGPLIEMDIK